MTSSEPDDAEGGSETPPGRGLSGDASDPVLGEEDVAMPVTDEQLARSLAEQAEEVASPAIEWNLPCAGCGYNLRGLRGDGKCPECGAAVERAMTGNALWLQSPYWIATLRFGSRMLAITALITVVSFVCGLIAYGQVRNPFLWGQAREYMHIAQGLALLTLLCGFTASWMIGVPPPPRAENAGRTMAIVLRNSAGLTLVLGAVLVLRWPGHFGSDRNNAVFMMIVAAVSLIEIITLYLLLGGYASRLSRPGLAAGFVIAMLFRAFGPLLVLATHGYNLAMRVPGAPWQYGFEGLDTYTLVLGQAWTAVLAIILAGALRDAARYAKHLQRKRILGS